MTLLLEMTNISKEFPGVKALDNVSFSLKKGEVHCLIGANGAGKSTLIKVLSGVHQSDAGQIIYEEKQVKIESPKDSQDLGISTIYQELSLVDELSVAENIFLGSYLKEGNGFIKWEKMQKEAEKLLQHLGVNVSPKELVKNLSMGSKQMIEIAKSLAQDTKILIMDEPTTALSMQETEKLFEVIMGLKNQGITIIFISHKLDELYEIGDRITVLRNGNWILTDDAENIHKEELIRHITGRKNLGNNEKTDEEANLEHDQYLKVKNFTTEKLKDVSFYLNRGEILGFYGLVGSGRTELLRALFGADSLLEGSTFINGKEVEIKNPQQAVELGFGLVPENRKTEGLVQELSVAENVLLPSLNNNSKYSFLNPRKLRKLVDKGIKDLNIKTKDGHTIVRNLSGGNQQKVIILKWLIYEANILLFDEPTQGIDVGSKSEIYSLINNLSREKGRSVIVASSELEELLMVCDRILVMFDGKIINEFTKPNEYRDEILYSAVSGN